jgi:hypothetical protein
MILTDEYIREASHYAEFMDIVDSHLEANARIRELAVALEDRCAERLAVVADALAEECETVWNWDGFQREKKRADRAKASLRELAEAFQIMRDASFQSHYGHWDRDGTGGLNCPECIRSRELRERADELAQAALAAAKGE